ncbi:phosphoribosyltransferase-like protein, partial [Enterococcus faecium]|uniref:phosphoribosyltransferase-like protein n=2 Tax=Enterococcus TaxID=1350 RepID=UPI003CEF18EE
TFYNQDDVRHLCKILYNSFFHQVIIDFSLSNEEEINEYMNNVSYAAIGRASESGNYLLYDFRQEADLNINKFFYPTNIKS